jgi:Peptidase family M28
MVFRLTSGMPLHFLPFEWRLFFVSILRVLAAFTFLLSLTEQCFAQYAGAAPVPDEYAAGIATITEEASRELLAVLVSEEFAGRGTGQEGYYKAARWYADQLADAGFQPGGEDGSWFQMVPLIREAVNGEACGIALCGQTIVHGDAFGATSYTGRFDQCLPVTFVTTGAGDQEITDGQFAGQLVIVQTARRIRTNHPLIVRGKPACLLSAIKESRVRTESVSAQERATSVQPMGSILISEARVLAQKCGLDGIFSDDDVNENRIESTDTRVQCRLTIERESIDVPNVLGWYPGTDESVRNEHIAIGAHLDHLGQQRGRMYPGADDNGSGSTAILQIARAVATGELKPRRSVLAIVFCGEERGLLGSRYYANNPVHPIEDMICMLNIDMIGRNEESDTEPASDNQQTMHLVGSKRISEELHDFVIAANQHIGFEFEYDEERVYTRSDHANFAAKGVPITFLFGGFSPFYHQTTDTLEGINFAKIGNAARLNYLVLMKVAEHGHLKRNDDGEPESAAGAR